jgi:cell wall-associated NlpC family hydrolase
MKPYFANPELLARLQFHAGEWLGTPFMPNAAIKGAGVSCQKLVGALYRETGFFPADLAIPDGPMNWGVAQKQSLIADWVATHPELFAAVTDVQPGDLLGFRLGGCIHHSGVVLTTDGKFIHAMRDRGCLLSSSQDATYLQRLEAIWRPIIP